jgi:hypothetical protein
MSIPDFSEVEPDLQSPPSRQRPETATAEAAVGGEAGLGQLARLRLGKPSGLA